MNTPLTPLDFESDIVYAVELLSNLMMLKYDERAGWTCADAAAWLSLNRAMKYLAGQVK